MAGGFIPTRATDKPDICLLCRGINDTPTAHKMAAVTHATTYQEYSRSKAHYSLFFFSWANEMER
ncbi:hypothetical protein KSZ_78530 [Dictyobacter formicarum]|uniref:Uncharacterized protein n=1 Tax=Dictyobacter formicarum TaxID=2778368 RepID=A0ABQ3VU92_9CHLR|nr:hypothetical protein KSZ_78530 [Dictyobacter formicarum]